MPSPNQLAKKVARLFRVPKKILLYFKEFGLAKGWGYLKKLRISPKTGEVVQIEAPSLGRTLSIRAGTSDTFVMEALILYDDSELPQEVTNSVQKSKGLVVDAGANIGLNTLLMHKKWPNHTIVALECDKENFEILLKNVEGISQVKPMLAALWHTKTMVEIADPSVPAWSRQVKEGGSGTSKVQALSLSDILAETQTNEIAFLKCDIEGAEKSVMDALNPESAPILAALVELHERKVAGCEESFASFAKRYDKKVKRAGEYHLAAP